MQHHGRQILDNRRDEEERDSFSIGSSRKKRSSGRGPKFDEGTRIEAKVKGWSKFYPGRVEKVNRDGTYELVFDDGDRKSRVEEENIRALKPKPSPRRVRRTFSREADF